MPLLRDGGAWGDVDQPQFVSIDRHVRCIVAALLVSRIAAAHHCDRAGALRGTRLRVCAAAALKI
ncbi:MAG: hypothetical protein ACC683_11355 [Acidimicrobiia bacterium]